MRRETRGRGVGRRRGGEEAEKEGSGFEVWGRGTTSARASFLFSAPQHPEVGGGHLIIRVCIVYCIRTLDCTLSVLPMNTYHNLKLTNLESPPFRQ